jgi:hypothetical protein
MKKMARFLISSRLKSLALYAPAEIFVPMETDIFTDFQYQFFDTQKSSALVEE